MTIRVGINGFGRMGRLALRAGWDRPDLEFVHINEPYGGLKGAAHLLEFDSVHGRWDRTIGTKDGQLKVGDKSIAFSEADSPAKVAWQELNLDIVLECSGKFRTVESLTPYLDAGVKKVIVSAASKNLVKSLMH